jgi:hypothetical protein
VKYACRADFGAPPSNGRAVIPEGIMLITRCHPAHGNAGAIFPFWPSHPPRLGRPVSRYRLKKIGINVDLQLSEWGSVSARRAKKDPPDQGGWNLFHTSANGAQLASPLVSPSTIMTCDGKNFVGWPCDEKEEALRQQYIQETDPEKQKGLVEAMHRRLWEVVPYVPLGQLKQPFLWRKNISGVLKANTLARPGRCSPARWPIFGTPGPRSASCRTA